MPTQEYAPLCLAGTSVGERSNEVGRGSPPWTRMPRFLAGSRALLRPQINPVVFDRVARRPAEVSHRVHGTKNGLRYMPRFERTQARKSFTRRVVLFSLAS